jgi:hypothetical protein
MDGRVEFVSDLIWRRPGLIELASDLIVAHSGLGSV